MKNSIAERIANFLKEYQPFSHLSYNELTDISSNIEVISLDKNKTIFQVDDLLHEFFYVVNSGVINLSVISDAEEMFLTKCVTGDILGLRPFFATNNYKMSATAREDTVLFAIPINLFRSFVINNPEILEYLLRSFASTSPNPNEKSAGSLPNESLKYIDNQSEIQYFQSLSYNKNPLTTTPATIIQHVAQNMTDNLVSCVIIQENDKPIGIITDEDLRIKVATGKFYITAHVNSIMTSPVFCVPQNISLAEAQLIMLQYNINHLCVTVDGTDRTDIKGVISIQDIIAAQSSNPGVLIKEIKKAKTIEELMKSREKLSDFIQNALDKRIPLSHINNISGEVNMALIRRCIDLAILQIGSPPVRFAWLSIGSQGRKEQLLLTDQDNMLIFEDVANDQYKNVKEFFINLSNIVVNSLVTIGYKKCPNGHTANNPVWCKSLTDWIKQYDAWMNTPGEKSEDSNSIFFDYEYIYGETDIEENLTEHLFRNITTNKKFLAFLGTDALKKPSPLTFFKQFSVEEDGEHKDLFDIKTRAIMPLVDAARLLILSNGIRGINNTFLRFKQLAINESKYSEHYLNAADAFLTLSKFRTLEGLKNNTDGQFINLNEMSKSDKEKLKICLAPMKDLEEIIKNKFKLTYFT